ncbi:MAG: GNAT family N-acetyltransferase [Alphaproteobacteria bacterium]|nr:GNAT family N-acetyltransferase [Alphaproteobacteria bacterium]
MAQRATTQSGSNTGDRHLDASGEPLLTISVAADINEIEGAWRHLEAGGIESPGQAFEFVRTWVQALEIAPRRQVYISVHAGTKPVLVMGLGEYRRFGARVLGWLPGLHVGCNGPLIDGKYFSTLNQKQRTALWGRVLQALPPVDALHLLAVPDGLAQSFGKHGRRGVGEFVYRAEFSSWQECDRVQRTRKRRKRDRQQGAKLALLGDIEFGVARPDEYDHVLKTMFAQKAARFADLGITDPFANEKVRGFYHDIIAHSQALEAKIFVLRLNGEIVAVRYCLGRDKELYALISSMSENRELQSGSPGKQSLFRIVQTIFDEGYRSYDLGAGQADEKRNWCNREIAVAHYFFPKTATGWVFMAAQRALDFAKRKVKTDARLLTLYKRLKGRTGPDA